MVTGPMTATELVASMTSPLAVESRRLAARVRSHEVFGRLSTASAVRVFMEHHVWAVWDFMSLLKSVQAAFAPVRVPWVPPPDPEASRMVNEIVAGEESDDTPDGGHASHFDIYLRAMDEAGARTGAVCAAVRAVAEGAAWADALRAHCPIAAAREFVATTLNLAEASVPERVAAFTLGREDIIPSMFHEVLRGLDLSEGADLRLFRWYLDRHVSVDAGLHGPLATRLFAHVCLTDDVVRDISLRAASRALSQRLALWDAAARAIDRA